MLVMTAKINKKKIVIGLAVVAVIIAAILMLFGNPSEPTAAPSVSTNDGRVAFLASFGWEVNASPTESNQVRIPAQTSQVFERYNALQKSQNYDLTPYAGKTVMRYVYRVTNYPGATEPVYATLLVYKNQIIGGDITDTAANGLIHSFQKSSTVAQPRPSLPTTPSTAPDATVPNTVD